MPDMSMISYQKELNFEAKLKGSFYFDKDENILIEIMHIY